MIDWQTIALTAGHLITGIVAGSHALLRKTEPRAAQLWLIICLFIPFAGPFAYFLFGINRIETRAKRLLEPTLEDGGPGIAADLDQPFDRFARIGDRVVGSAGRGDNGITPLINGEAAYTAMLEAIRGARSSVYLSTYIFCNDDIGRQFVTALKAASDRGVRVRVLVDAIGEWYSYPRISRRLDRAGIPFKRFLPPRWFPPFGYVNLRNHRKLLLVDGNLGFTGGMNIGDRHVANIMGHHEAEDVHFEFEGPIVQDLEGVFADDWQFAADERLPVSTSQTPAGHIWCRVVPDGPNEDLDKLSMIIQGAIANANHSVTIMTPYFLPERDLLVGLQTAALRGVNVSVVLPERSNLPYVDWATQHLLPSLTQRGVRIYRRAPFSHAKLLVVDDCYGLVGTANLDPRSLRLNFELGVEIFDSDFAREMGHLMRTYMAQGNEISTNTLLRRSLPARLRDAVFALFSPYL